MICRSTMKEPLKNCLLFARLSDEQLDRVVRHAVKIRLHENEAIFEQGDPADRFFLVLSGQICLYRLSPNGHEKIIDIVMPGQTFAEVLMFEEHPCYPVGARALYAGELISIDARDYAELLGESIPLCFAMLGDLSKRLRSLIREIDELSLKSATSRVATYLYNQLPPDRDSYRLTIPKQAIASRLSVTPETFSRIIRRLQSEDIIVVDGAEVTVPSRDQFRRFLEVIDG